MDPSSSSSSTATNGNPSNLADTNRTSDFAVPYQDDEHSIASPPQGTRVGTSATRFEQQAHTHAEGQLSHGTPEVRVDGQGEKFAVMDPHTVGQAPKEHKLPRPEEPAPSIIEQAKAVAGQAMAQTNEMAEGVMNAVGWTGGKKSKEDAEAQTEKKEDPEVDAMDGGKVEEFLRSKSTSKPQN